MKDIATVNAYITELRENHLPHITQALEDIRMSIEKNKSAYIPIWATSTITILTALSVALVAHAMSMSSAEIRQKEIMANQQQILRMVMQGK